MQHVEYAGKEKMLMTNEEQMRGRASDHFT